MPVTSGNIGLIISAASYWDIPRRNFSPIGNKCFLGFLAVAERAIQSPSPEIAVEWELRKKDGALLTLPLMSRRMTLTRDDGRVTEAFFVVVVEVPSASAEKAADYFK